LEFLAEYGLFLAKAITLVVCLVVVIAIVMSAGHKSHKTQHGHIEVTQLNELYKPMSETRKHAVMDQQQAKKLAKYE